MKPELLQEIEKQIDKAAIDGTLSKEAAKLFHETIEANEKLHEKLAKETATVIQYRDQIDELRKDSMGLRDAILGWEDRERLLIERETKMTELEMKAANEAQRVQDHKDMFSIVFKPASFRESIWRSRDIVSDGYPTGSQASENGTVEREES